MRIIDEDGRLFGRVNLIDAGVVVLVIGVVPLAYLSWHLFRMPTPVVHTVYPVVVSPGKEPPRLQLQGENLRPYLRVTVGGVGADYFYQSPSRAEIQVPPLGPGTYDIVFFDAFAEIGRRPNALRVEWPFTDGVTARYRERHRDVQRLDLHGWHLSRLLLAEIGGLAAPYEFKEPGRAEVELPALAPGTYDVVLFTKNDLGPKELGRYAGAVTIVEQRVALHAVTRPEVIEMIKQDLASQADSTVTTRRAILASYETAAGCAGAAQTNPECMVRAVVRVAAIMTPYGWQYEGQALKVGAPFHLESLSYVLDGEVRGLRLAPARQP